METSVQRVDDADAEVSAAFSAGLRPPVALVRPGSPGVLGDRSEDEESDHTPDPYTQHMRGRVSPSPYTANTERARQFNVYVRSVIEQRLDVLVPISHQPRDLISNIISDASEKFPEFSSCVRKRIRTYLKSYRRSKKVKEGGVIGIGALAQNGINTKTEELATCLLPTAVVPHLTNSTSASEDRPMQPSTAVVTIITDGGPQSNDVDAMPEAKRPCLAPPTPPSPPPPAADAMHNASKMVATSISSGQNLSSPDVTAVKQLITGYRESAAFLLRAADQLETMLSRDSSSV